jgi:metallo-beta-lactamase class B
LDIQTSFMLTRFIPACLFAVLFFLSTALCAQKVKEPKPWSPDWTKPYQPFRIAGNLYYVGTYDLACYLITTPKGHILINTGLAASAATIKKNVETLGFRFSAIKILLNTQAHYDHLGAMATIKQKTGATLMIHEKDAAEAKEGGHSDYALGGNGSTFKPVTPDQLLKDGDTIRLGDMQLVLLHHPGHTKGASSFLFTVNDDKQSWKVLIANMPSIVTDKPFAEVHTYPEIATDYAYTFKAMKNISFDLWLSSHASQFNMHAKHQPGDAYNPAAFNDQAGYDTALSKLQKEYDDKIKQQ